VTVNGSRVLLTAVAAFAVAAAAATRTQSVEPAGGAWAGALDEHPAIQYAARPTTDRVGALSRRLADPGESLRPDGPSRYLRPLLDALDIPVESQLLVFSKTGVQRAFTGPHTPRALYFDDSVVVGYIPGAPAIEIAAHDPQQGVVFYTLDQTSARSSPVRQTMCLSCHVSASTANVPGIIARSNFVAEDGNILPQLGVQVVDHSTGHPDRWGGWYVTSEDGPPPYSQRAHQGNITFTLSGATSNEVFVNWLGSTPAQRGYPLPSSDVVALLAFDHQARAINLLTRLNWEWRIAEREGRARVDDAEIGRLTNDLAEYLLYAREAHLQAPLRAPAAFASHLRSRFPKDSRGRSLADLELASRLARYPCSYLVYSEAFDALPSPVRQVIYARMSDVLSNPSGDQLLPRVSTEERRAALEILRETKPDFPRR
jgi:hypothetical protein